MVKLSVAIPVKNDFAEVILTVANLTKGISPEKLQVIVVNDGSVFGSGKFRPIGDIFEYPNVVRVDNHFSGGVGYSFDRGAELVNSDILVIMGSDIRVREGWYDKVVEAVQSYPNTLGCAVSIGLNEDRMDMDDPKCSIRYGADLLVKVGAEDLPKNSRLLKKDGTYTALFKSKWITEKKSDSPYKIPSLLGAFYFTSRDYYNKLGGWDTQAGERYMGHRFWGNLEPHISLKSWLYGGGCMLFPDIEAGHIFGRIIKNDRWKKGLRSPEWLYWNQLFIAETLVEDEFRQELYDYLHYEKTLGMAQRMIRDNYSDILKVRERNLRFANGKLLSKEMVDGHKLIIQ